MSKTPRSLVLGLVLAALGVSGAPRASAQEGPAAEDPGPSALAELFETVQEGDVPVKLDGEVLYYVRLPAGAFSAEERAARAERVILSVARDPFYSPELITLEDRGHSVHVFYRGEEVGSLTMDDAEAWGVSPMRLAEQSIQVITAAIAEYRLRQRPEAWMQGVLILLAAAAVLALLIRWIRRLHARLCERMRASSAAHQGVVDKSLGIHAKKLLDLNLRLLLWGRNAVILILALLFLQVSFWALPITNALARGLLHYVTVPLNTLWQGFVANVGDLSFIVVIAVLTRLFLRLTRWVAGEVESGTIELSLLTPATAVPAYKVFRIVVVAIAAMMIYPYVPGSSSAAFKGIGLFAGALFTLGASGTASSLIGGVTLIFTDVYRIGDRVRIGEVLGEVIDVSLLMTRVRTTKNEVAALSNGSVMSQKIINYSKEARGRGLILHTSVTIGYDIPWRQVNELLLQSASATEGIESQPAPFVLQTSLDDFYVSYEINAFTRDANSMPRIYSDLHGNIQDAFQAAGVEIMSPHYAALRDGGASTAVSEGAPAAEPRPFVVRQTPDPTS